MILDAEHDPYRGIVLSVSEVDSEPDLARRRVVPRSDSPTHRRAALGLSADEAESGRARTRVP
jgi:hypothetical protein